MEKKKINKKTIAYIIGALVLLLLFLWCIYNCIEEVHIEGGTKFIFNVTSFELSSVQALLLGIFIIAFIGYLFGRIKIKGISFGTAGVFLVAILFGYLFTLEFLKDAPIINKLYIENSSSTMYTYYSSIVKNIGLVLFISSVGFVAGPSFFENLKRRGKVLFFVASSVCLTGAVIAILFALIPGISPLFSVGVLAGANTTTPGYSSALEAAELIGSNTELVTLGYAVGYPFGVILIVLFVQVLPKILKSNIKDEVKLLNKNTNDTLVDGKNYFKIDPFDLAPFSIATLLGILVGTIKIPLSLKGFEGPCFSLGITGGALLVSVLMGHFGHIGKLNISVNPQTSKVLRELGLLLFLIGSGVSGGVALVDQITKNGSDIIIYGLIASFFMALLPLIVGFIVSKYILKLNVVECLGYITGGRTSTPALGMLIHTTGSDAVASLYASTYPIALIYVVIIPQIIINLFL